MHFKVGFTGSSICSMPFFFLYAPPFWGLSFFLVPKALSYTPGTGEQQVFQAHFTGQGSPALVSRRELWAWLWFPCLVWSTFPLWCICRSQTCSSYYLLPDQPLLNTWHFNSRTMDICISFLSVVMTFKILLYMWSIIAMCWSRGGFKAFTYNTTESGEWEQELGKVVIMA